MQPSPIIVKIPQSTDDPTGLAHVFVEALGITGALTLLAVICGVILAGLLFWVRSREP